MTNEILISFWAFVQRQRWALFLYLSALMHLSLFTHLAIKGTPVNELAICNQPLMQLSVQMMPQPPSQGQQEQKDDGGGFQNGPMADSGKNGQGDFAQEFGIPGGKWKEQLDRTEEGEELNDSYGSKDDSGSAVNPNVPEEYRKRKRDYRNIIAKDIFPTLKTIDKPFREEIKEAPQELEKMLDRNEVIENYRLWREGKSIPDKKRTKVALNTPRPGTAGALAFDESARRKYFDETLSDPKEQQLERFLKDYGNFDPNEGDLPRAIRDLYYENLQRVASSFHPDMTYLAIDYFHEALNKEEFLRRALDVVSKKKGTKYATEILFAVENIYEIQGRALKLLYEVKRHIAALPAKEKDNIRVKTLEKVVERYIPLAEKKGIRNERDALQHYYLKRTEVLDYLLENTPGGYRTKDATFAKAKVFWESSDPMNPASWPNAKRAVDLWRSIDQLSDNGDFVSSEAHAAMRDALQKFKVFASPEATQIRIALDKETFKIMQKKTERENRILWSSKKTTTAGKQ
ncbi:hypothetical protein [Turneriella parva]|uniref:Uncharacterized protein n=1 Tax=Turneriella parva (strain ATCC BAA-1111 / DSM 21527 / NCTC 11395 / H) TaxID=869212 RepID=I4B3K3_TURPD|nr:hypothetical protein [Turneriella parva]AFM11860.1 hypothetical protein Turpa_1212 [Turneriella parva DSM 21527]